MSYVFYKVQITKRENCGYKMYTTKIEDIKTFEEIDKKKAISLWKKRKANTIWRHEVEHLNKAPYYTDKWCEGLEEYDTSCNKYLVFRINNEVIEKIRI